MLGLSFPQRLLSAGRHSRANAYPLNRVVRFSLGFEEHSAVASSISALLVDDDFDTRDMYEIALSDAGIRVIHAEDGADALSRAAEAIPDVIVTDLSIPKIDGFELLTRLRRDPRMERIPVIVLSGWVDTDTSDRAMAAGALAFLPKPCAPDLLVSEIRRATARTQPTE